MQSAQRSYGIADSKAHSQRSPGAVAASLGVVASLQAAAVIWFIGRRMVSDDQAVSWVAARDWLSLTPHQPNFYGQSYGSPFEAACIAVLHATGLDYRTALPVVLGLLALAPWWALAFAAHRRGRTHLTVAAAAAPLVLSGYYSVFVTVTQESQVARCLVVFSVAIMLTKPKPRVEAVAWALVGLGVALDASSLLLGGPAATWFLLSRPVRRERLIAIGVGSLVALAWLAAHAYFYGTLHPDYALHETPSLRPSIHTLWRSVRHTDRLFGLYVFELVRSPVLPVLLLAALIGLLLWTRTPAAVASGVVAIAVLAFGLATPKSQDDLGLFLPPGRILLVLPFAMWFFVFAIADSGWRPRIAVDQRTAIAGLACVALASVGARAIWPTSRVLHWREYATSPDLFGYRYERTSDVARRCRDIASTARTTGAELVVFRTFIGPYACGVLEAPRLETLLPEYDRRTWRLYDELHRSRDVALFWDAQRDFCTIAAPYVTSCRRLAPQGAVVRFPSESVLSLVAAVHWPIRPFGPACRPLGGYLTLRCAHPQSIPPAHRRPS